MQTTSFPTQQANRRSFIRLMGGGFGGCTITLIKKGKEEAVKQKFAQLYQEKWNIELKIYDVKIGNGTSLYEPS